MNALVILSALVIFSAFIMSITGPAAVGEYRDDREAPCFERASRPCRILGTARDDRAEIPHTKRRPSRISGTSGISVKAQAPWSSPARSAPSPYRSLVRLLTGASPEKAPVQLTPRPSPASRIGLRFANVSLAHWLEVHAEPRWQLLG
jgi:hypothetical protein